MKTVSFILCLFVSTITIHAQSIENEIPFRLTKYNNIIIPIALNEKDTADLMFHTGSDYVSIIEKSLPKFKTIKFNDTIKDVKSWAGYSDQAMSLNNQIKLGKNNFNKIPIFIDQQSGHESDGKIGMKFFENQYLEINFETNRLKVYNELPQHSKSYQKLNSKYENQTLYFDVTPIINQKQFTTEVMFHTGYSGAIIFSDSYAKKHQLLEILKSTGETEFSDAAGNKIISKKSILPKIFINKNQLKNVPISFFDSQVKIQSVNIFGGDLIKRFNWIFSSDLKTIYLKKNKFYKEEYFKI